MFLLYTPNTILSNRCTMIMFCTLYLQMVFFVTAHTGVLFDWVVCKQQLLQGHVSIVTLTLTSLEKALAGNSFELQRNTTETKLWIVMEP